MNEIRQVKLEPNSGYSKRVGTPTMGVLMAASNLIFIVQAWAGIKTPQIIKPCMIPVRAKTSPPRKPPVKESAKPAT